MILSSESSLDGARAVVNDDGLVDEDVLGRGGGRWTVRGRFSGGVRMFAASPRYDVTWCAVLCYAMPRLATLPGRCLPPLTSNSLYAVPPHQRQFSVGPISTTTT